MTGRSAGTPVVAILLKLMADLFSHVVEHRSSWNVGNPASARIRWLACGHSRRRLFAFLLENSIAIEQVILCLVIPIRFSSFEISH